MAWNSVQQLRTSEVIVCTTAPTSPQTPKTKSHPNVQPIVDNGRFRFQTRREFRSRSIALSQKKGATRSSNLQARRSTGQVSAPAIPMCLVSATPSAWPVAIRGWFIRLRSTHPRLCIRCDYYPRFWIVGRITTFVFLANSKKLFQGRRPVSWCALPLQCS